MKKNYLHLYYFTFLLTILGACGTASNSEEKNTSKKNEVAATEEVKDTTSKKKDEQVTGNSAMPPIINITDTLSKKGIIIYMKDSAATMDRIAGKLANIYGEKLGSTIKKNKLSMAGSPMAWYNPTKKGYFFEAGIPVDKKPSKFPNNIFVREISVDSVTVAHFYGPYNLLPQAYEALTDWMKNNKKTLVGKPYEVYVDDPMDSTGKAKDPYKVRTDVIFPWK